ncbi:phage tail tube protein, partial [Salmonella enterica subsp. enterica serovar Montevideo]|nr:phage tail tube protein [Salmonella enterica subsp. enterica serovar Montevideo]
MMARIGGTCYFKIDGQQLSLTGGIEVPMNRTVNDDIIGLDGKIATLGDRVEVTPGLKIRIDGHLISVKESAEQICRVLAYY